LGLGAGAPPRGGPPAPVPHEEEAPK
jgi:hypothetical protein